MSFFSYPSESFVTLMALLTLPMINKAMESRRTHATDWRLSAEVVKQKVSNLGRSDHGPYFACRLQVALMPSRIQPKFALGPCSLTFKPVEGILVLGKLSIRALLARTLNDETDRKDAIFALTPRR